MIASKFKLTFSLNLWEFHKACFEQGQLAISSPKQSHLLTCPNLYHPFFFKKKHLNQIHIVQILLGGRPTQAHDRPTRNHIHKGTAAFSCSRNQFLIVPQLESETCYPLPPSIAWLFSGMSMCKWCTSWHSCWSSTYNCPVVSGKIPFPCSHPPAPDWVLFLFLSSVRKSVIHMFYWELSRFQPLTLCILTSSRPLCCHLL